MNMDNLYSIGWSEERNKEFNEYIELTGKKDLCYGRVIGSHYDFFQLQTPDGRCLSKPLGSLRQGQLWPAVGDWVLYMPLDVPLDGNATAVIHHVLSRKSYFTRAASGKRTGQQVIASNIDYVGIVAGMDRDFNLRRIERYMTLIWDSGAEPILILNKADLVENPEILVQEAEKSAPGARVIAVSAACRTRLDFLQNLLSEGATAVLVGSSGVGKSTLVNALLGEDKQKTNEIRNSDGKGRHTTTTRELFLLSSGGALIDTPGMREVGLRSESEGVSTSFEEITTIAPDCKFSDCTHKHEPGCAVLNALKKNEISAERYNAYIKQQEEIEFVRNKEEALRRKNKWEKDIAKSIKNLKEKR